MSDENVNVVPHELKDSKKKLIKKLLPLILMVAVILLDQLTKALVVKYIKPHSVGFSMFGDLLRFIHVYNPGIAFSLGNTLSQSFRNILFAALPLLVLVLVLVIYFRNDDFSNFQRWTIAGILGGGFGNIIDRIFREKGVVDFIDVKFFGIFGFERWPTFNIADSAVVVCGIMLIISFICGIVKERSKKNQ